METLGRYRLLRRVAVGGMAEIFLAESPGPSGIPRNVAIKRILPHRADDAEFVGMFLNEARVAAMLNHPHIVQIFDMGEAEGRYFIAMEFVQGYDLGQILDQSETRKQPIPPIYIANAIAQASAGLHYAHFYKDPNTGQPLNLIHRDISLPNIMVSLDGDVKILDFGIAKATTNDGRPATQTGVLKGKISYMSPEYLMGEKIDWRHDLFALGVMMYELLTGQKPFRAKGDVQMLQAILTQKPQDPYQFNPTVPEALIQITMRLLDKDREQRYQNGSQLEYDLREAIRQIAGYDITPSHISHYLKELFSGSPNEVIAFADNQNDPHYPSQSNASHYPSQSNASHYPSQSNASHYPSQSNASHQRNRGGYGFDDEPFNPFQEKSPQAASMPNMQVQSWQEETKCLSTADVSDVAYDSIPSPNTQNPIPSYESPTAALIINEDGSFQPSSISGVDEISQALQQSRSSNNSLRQTTDLDDLHQTSPVAPSLQTEAPPQADLLVKEKGSGGGLLVGLLALVTVIALGGGLAWFFFSPTTDPTDIEDSGPPTLQAKTTQPPTITKKVAPVKQPVKRPPTRRTQQKQPVAPKPIDLSGARLILKASSPPCPCTVYWMNKNRRLGRTPLHVRLPAGKHRFALRKRRPHVSIPFVLTLANGQLSEKFIRIREGLLTLKLPPNAKVYLDGNYLGRTPLAPIRLFAGYHTLRLQHRNLSQPRTHRIFVRNLQRYVFKQQLR